MTTRAAVIAAILMFLAFSAVLAAASRSSAPPVATWRPVTLNSEAPPDPGFVAATGDASIAPSPSSSGELAGSPSPMAATASPTRSPERTSPWRPPERAGATESRVVVGSGSWFCRPPTSACTRGYPASGAYAAAGPALRVGAWRGRWVTVNGLRVRLIDWCLCGGGKVIDLYASQFAKLAPLSRGIVSVRVSW